MILGLSGGVDSSMLLFAMLECGKKPKAGITFKLGDGEDNRDLFFAKKIAKMYDFPLNVAKIPIKDKAGLIKDIERVLELTEMPRAIDTQVAHAFLYMVELLKKKKYSGCGWITGMYENCHYFNPNMWVNNYHRDVLKGKMKREEFDKWYNELREAVFKGETAAGKPINYKSNDKLIQKYGFHLVTPLWDKKLYALSKKRTYDDMFLLDGKLKKKYWITNVMFKEEFERTGNGTNINNMQDMGLKQYHRDLLLPGSGYKKEGAIYNRIFKSMSKQKGFFK